MTRASSAAEQLLKSLEGPLEVVLGAPYGERAISCLKQSRLAAAVCVLLVVLLTLAAGAVASGSSAKKKPDNSDPVHYDVSPPLRDMTPATPPPADPKKDKEPKKGLPVPGQSSVPDPVVQTTPGADAAPPVGTGFEGDERALARSLRERRLLPVIPVGHLILMKLESGRSKDDADVVELLKAGASPAAVARYLRRTWPELLPRFRRLTAQARTERTPRPRRPPVRRTRR